jgi:hypothetical protein
LLAKPTTTDWCKLRRVGRYVAGYIDYVMRLIPSGGELCIRCQCDSDWAGDRASRKSTSGGVVTFCGATLLSYSRTQGVVATSSGEAELYSMASVIAEALMLQSMLSELLGMVLSITVECDSTAALAIASRASLGALKHVQIKLLAVQEWVRERHIKLRKIGTDSNCSDVLTKFVNQVLLKRHSIKIGLRGE